MHSSSPSKESMKSLRSHVVRTFKRQLERRGRMVVPQGWGLDPLADVRRLAQIWRYPLELLFDIGANEGQTAKRFLQEFPGAEVLSFEPHPATFARLTEKMSEAPHFRAFNLGLSTEIGETEMFEYAFSTINNDDLRRPSKNRTISAGGMSDWSAAITAVSHCTRYSS